MTPGLSLPADAPAPGTEELRFRRDLVVWNALWLAAVLGSLLVLRLGWPELTGRMVLGLVAMAAPAAMSLAPLPLRLHRNGVLLAGWAAAGALAATLTGGVAGPLVAWCLSPLAAAALSGRRRPMILAAVLSLTAGAVAALAELAGAGAKPSLEGLQIWLALVSLFTTGAGLAFGVVLGLRRVRAPAVARTAEMEAAAQAAEPDVPPSLAESLMAAQPHLLVGLTGDGRVAAAYGEPPEGLARPEPGASLYDSASLASRPALINAVRTAVQEGRAQADFAPIGEPDRTCAIILKARGDQVVAAVFDVSQDRWREAAAEAARAEAEALNAGKSRFLANMSHELRTPLNAVIGFSDVMRARLFGDLPPRYAEYAEMIHESGRHLLDLINDVLDMSKIEAERYHLQLEPFDAREAVSAALRLVRVQADGAGISLRGILPPGPLEVDADRRALKQIVLNLTSNALKFTPRGGAVTVTTQAEGGDLTLAVVDTGVGIAPEDLERLGRPYEQAGDAGLQAQGTGLGLSLVRAFAELHGGTMVIESVLGEGTRVTVRLPVMQGERGAEPPQPQGAQIIPFSR